MRFTGGRAAASFPSRWLSHRVAAANPMLHRHSEREAEGLGEAAQGSFASHVRRPVTRTIASARCTATGTARLPGMRERTMHRRRRLEGTTFKRVHDQVRQEVSRQLLANTSMTLAAIAAAPDCAEASTYIRAFARWSGITPAQWRHARRHAAAAPEAD